MSAEVARGEYRGSIAQVSAAQQRAERIRKRTSPAQRKSMPLPSSIDTRSGAATASYRTPVAPVYPVASIKGRLLRGGDSRTRKKATGSLSTPR